MAVRLESLLGAAVPMRSDQAESHGAHLKRNQLVSSQASPHDGFLGTAHFDVLLLFNALANRHLIAVIQFPREP